MPDPMRLQAFISKTMRAMKRAEEAGDIEALDRYGSYLERAKPLVERALSQPPPAPPQDIAAAPGEQEQPLAAPPPPATGETPPEMAGAPKATRFAKPTSPSGAIKPPLVGAPATAFGQDARQGGFLNPPAPPVQVPTPAELQMPELPEFTPMGGDLGGIGPGVVGSKLNEGVDLGAAADLAATALVPPYAMAKGAKAILPKIGEVAKHGINAAGELAGTGKIFNEPKPKAVVKGSVEGSIPTPPSSAAPTPPGPVPTNPDASPAANPAASMMDDVKQYAVDEEAAELARIEKIVGPAPEALSLENLVIMLLMGAPRAFSKIISENQDYRNAMRSALTKHYSDKRQDKRYEKTDEWREREVKANELRAAAADANANRDRSESEEMKNLRTLAGMQAYSPEDAKAKKWATDQLMNRMGGGIPLPPR